jgi:hypothetical protein
MVARKGNKYKNVLDVLTSDCLWKVGVRTGSPNASCPNMVACSLRWILHSDNTEALQFSSTTKHCQTSSDPHQPNNHQWTWLLSSLLFCRVALGLSSSWTWMPTTGTDRHCPPSYPENPGPTWVKIIKPLITKYHSVPLWCICLVTSPISQFTSKERNDHFSPVVRATRQKSVPVNELV